MTGRIDFAVEEGNATEKTVVVEESISISTKTSLAIDIQTRIRDHPCVGRYEIVTTPSQWNWCGVFALEISTFEQLKLNRFPLREQFHWIFRNRPEMLALNAQNGWNNHDNFFDEQLACGLRAWGRIEGLDYLRLQLGVIVEGAGFAYIIGDDKFLPVSSEAELEGEHEFTTIWIHNDNAQALHRGRMNHYSGIKLLDRRVEHVRGSEGEVANEEDYDADKEQETEGESSEEDSSTLSHEESSAEEDNDVEMADYEESGQETGEEIREKFLMLSDEGSDADVEDDEEMGPETEEELFTPEYSSMSSEKGSKMKMEDYGWVWQEADEGKFAEDSRRECSCDPAEEHESKRRRLC